MLNFRHHRSLLAILLLLGWRLAADTFYPVTSATDKPNPLASPHAVQGGSITEHLGPSPKSLNYYLDANTMSAQVFGLMHESLLERNPLTLEHDKGLAERWSISDDQMAFTFWLDPRARWSDGRPVTPEDVVWTFEAVLDPKNLTGSHKMELERLEKPEILPDGGIRFRAKELHWQNLNAAGGFAILPKHAYANQDFNKINFAFPVVSGPYAIAELKEGISLTMRQRPDWWQRYRPSTKGVFNFREIRYRFFADRNNAFEAFLKGEIDVMQIYTASQWHDIENKYKQVRRNWIVRQGIHNHQPIGFQGFAMNMRRPPFDDVRVREAMACLLDRETLNRTMMFDQYFLHRSYWEDLYDADHPCTNPSPSFNPDKARELFAQAGWSLNPQNGRLEKGGRPFVFSFASRDSSTEKFLVGFREALKEQGITMSIVNKDWSAWAKDMDEFNFDMTWCAWGAGVFKDPEGLWHSREASRPGSANITGFGNPEVDRLIDSQKSIFEVAARHEIVRQVDKLICRQFPYVLLWNSDCTRLLYWNKFGTPPTVTGKYGDDTSLWWFDEDRADELRDAMDNDEPLPPLPREIWFDKIWR